MEISSISWPQAGIFIGQAIREKNAQGSKTSQPSFTASVRHRHQDVIQAACVTPLLYMKNPALISMTLVSSLLIHQLHIELVFPLVL
jgi:hypothetical protein